MPLDPSRKRASVIDPTRPKAEQIEELRQAVLACYCGLGPACPIWNEMSPAERKACSSDKRASAQLLWKHGVVH
jgi:hypothetical protein